MVLKRAVRRGFDRIGMDLERWPHSGTVEELLGGILQLYDVEGVVDVGANVGRWAAAVRRLGFDGPLVSLEPVESAYVELCRRSAADPSWTAMRVAAGERCGEATIHVARSTSTSSLLAVNDYYRNRYEGSHPVGDETVELVTLDSIRDRLPDGRRLLLKVDTQGYDMKVLDGATELLTRVAALQTELSLQANYHGVTNSWTDVIDRMRGLGFSIAGLFHIERDEVLRQTEIDGVFVRTELAGG